MQKRQSKMIAEALPIAMSGLLVAGQAISLRSSDKHKKGGKELVPCPKCSRLFRNQAEVEEHSAGYHT